ncbi:uncharacterized protein N7473_002724 [Penicillium subrubescens]|uniref:uncharacterized protein n=1 Tax=Penicillium subrubescens TaxID=1316194 RepID=UPI0025457686|nr:uncharacterized protein N7473_002724 [Penicillium subrubescens]KAJ5905808.1 hypothetical protein N7473_002724 [Penicillium subrubescens]
MHKCPVIPNPEALEHVATSGDDAKGRTRVNVLANRRGTTPSASMLPPAFDVNNLIPFGHEEQVVALRCAGDSRKTTATHHHA